MDVFIQLYNDRSQWVMEISPKKDFQLVSEYDFEESLNLFHVYSLQIYTPNTE